MSMVNWAGLIVSVITILSSFVIGVGWLVRHYLQELKPNGGESLNDIIKLKVVPAIDTLLKHQYEISMDVAVLNAKFDQHVKESE